MDKRINPIVFRLGSSSGWSIIGFFDKLFYKNYFFSSLNLFYFFDSVFNCSSLRFFSNCFIKKRENSFFFLVNYCVGSIKNKVIKTRRRIRKQKRNNIVSKENLRIFWDERHFQLALKKHYFFFFNESKNVFFFFRRLSRRSAFADSGLVCMFIKQKLLRLFSITRIFSFILSQFFVGLRSSKRFTKNPLFNIRGIRLSYKGPRLNRVSRAFSKISQKGWIPLQDSSVEIDFNSLVVFTKFGAGTIKVWLCY